MFRGTYVKKPLTPVEQAFLFWYVSILGDEWRLIADILNYHPFTKGGIREPAEIRIYFYNLNESINLFYHAKIPIDPWRTTGMSILINQRPPSLLNSVHQSCLVNQNNLKAFTEAVNKGQKQITIKITEKENGEICLNYGRDQ